mgnify:CR=1 FL=1
MTHPTRRISPNLLLVFLFFSTILLSAHASMSALMSDAEIAVHTAKMAELEGQAREDYRNAQYQVLVQRAKAQGYDMPATPPWQAVAEAPAPAAPGPANESASQSDAPPANDTAAAHAAMREKMRAHREALMQAANTPPSAEDVPVIPSSSEATPPATAPAEPPQAVVVPAAPPLAQADTSADVAPQAEADPPASEAVSAEVAPEARPQPPASPVAPEPPAPPMQAESQPNNVAAMNAYREEMRSRFDAYMKERQAQMETMAQQQREQRESAWGSNYPVPPMQPGAAPVPPMPYGYPNMPNYGPRYPSAYPGYRTPYWQQ